MTSRVQIFNMALSHIGHKADVSDPDQASPSAAACRTFYEPALKVALERYDWSFARRRESLAEVTNLTSQWLYAYALPNLCVKPRTIFSPADSELTGQDFDLEIDAAGNGVLLTNIEDAVLRFTAYVESEGRFTPYFALTLSYDLAALLVGPIPKDPKLKQSMVNAAKYYADEAAAADANIGKSSNYKNFMPEGLAARNGD